MLIPKIDISKITDGKIIDLAKNMTIIESVPTEVTKNDDVDDIESVSKDMKLSDIVQIMKNLNLTHIDVCAEGIILHGRETSTTREF